MFRQLIIDTGLEVIADFSPLGKIHALEIGCMYTTKEGMSTFRIAHFLKSHASARKFASIEYNPEHISAAKEILESKDAGLLNEVEFFRGNSLIELPKALEKIKPVDFALLDGGAHPEVCLREFELVVQNLSENGLIILDDVQLISLPKTNNLQFGKGTLILPYLIINEYLEQRNIFNDRYTSMGAKPQSLLIEKSASTLDLGLTLRSLSYKLISKGNHKMLLVAKTELLETYLQKLNKLCETSLMVKLMLLKTRLQTSWGTLLGRTPESSIYIT